MSYLHEVNRNNHIYVYEISSYWDKAKKQSRQKRVYLGKKNKSTGEVVKKKSHPIPPTNSRSVGSIHFFKEISKILGLTKILKKNFPENYKDILYLSFFKITQKEAYYLYPLWYEEFYVSEESYMSSQIISNLLSEIGSNEIGVERFLAEWIKENRNGSNSVMFDITSISSYGSGNEFLDYGYNRDGENLNQVNLGILSQSIKKDKSLSLNFGCLPLGYRIYPGSITDVTSLKNIIKISNEYNLNLKCFVLDKGFYSQENVKDLACNGLSYIVPMSFSTSLSKDLVRSLDEKITSPESFFKLNGNTYFYAKKDIEIGYTKCVAHVYLDKQRRTAQESTMTIKICDFEERFAKKKFKSNMECEDYIQETLKCPKKFFKSFKKGKYFYIERDIESLRRETEKMGVIILLTPTGFKITRDEILNLYRSKDNIEKTFDSLKNDIKEKRNRTHSLRNMRGSLFISFISLILISRVDHVMKEKKLYEKFTKSEVYKILDQLKFYKLANETEILGELSGKQKSIFSAFKISKDIKSSYHF